MIQTKILKGPIAVTVTPVTDGCEPNYNELRRQTEWLCGTGITGLFPCSSTGEFVRFQTKEKIGILETVANQNKGRKRLIAGACGASLSEVLRYINAAKEYGYDACVVCPPYYYPQGQDDILRFYLRVVEEAGNMSIILYHVPFFTTGLTLKTIHSLMRLDSVIGIKDSSANMKQIAHTNQMKPKDFLVYTGTDDCLLPALTAGCDGSMTALAGILPEWIVACYEHFAQGNLEKACEIQRGVLPLLRLADALPFPAGYKLLAELRGLKTGPFFQTVSAEETAEIRGKMYEEIQKLILGGVLDESNGLAGLQ